jgi:ribosomal protein L40E
MSEKREALILACDKYEDKDIQKLSAPSRDAEDLANVLKNVEIGGFEVRKLVNRPTQEVRLEIGKFFRDRKLDDLLLLYFSGHGMLDKDGTLYYATTDTELDLLSETAISDESVRKKMGDCRSRRQVLVLDCCHSGKSAYGLVTKSDKSISTIERFGGEGRAVLAASDTLQFALEEKDRSIFTSTLVYGLESGEADRDGDGVVTFDELYDYIYDHVCEKTSNRMTPVKSVFVKGKIFIAKNPNVKPSKLDEDLLQLIESRSPEARELAVGELEKHLYSGHKGRSLAAHQYLRQLSKDDSRKVSEAATRALEKYVATKVISIKNKQLETICPSCQASLGPKARFCPRCGAIIGPKCACGFVSRPGAKFCGGCGEALI